MPPAVKQFKKGSVFPRKVRLALRLLESCPSHSRNAFACSAQNVALVIHGAFDVGGESTDCAVGITVFQTNLPISIFPCEFFNWTVAVCFCATMLAYPLFNHLRPLLANGMNYVSLCPRPIGNFLLLCGLRIYLAWLNFAMICDSLNCYYRSENWIELIDPLIRKTCIDNTSCGYRSARAV